MYEDTTKFYVQQSRLKGKVQDLETQIDALEKELCPDCKEKFKKIFNKNK